MQLPKFQDEVSLPIYLLEVRLMYTIMSIIHLSNSFFQVHRHNVHTTFVFGSDSWLRYVINPPTSIHQDEHHA